MFLSLWLGLSVTSLNINNTKAQNTYPVQFQATSAPDWCPHWLCWLDLASQAHGQITCMDIKMYM